MGPGFGEGLYRGMIAMLVVVALASAILGAGCVACVSYVRRNVTVSFRPRSPPPAPLLEGGKP